MQTIIEPNQTPRILVIRRRYVGDLVLIGPVFRNLRLLHPNAWITAVVDERYSDVLARNPDVSEVLGLPERGSENYAVFLRRWLSFVRQLRSRHFGVVYDLTQNNRSALISVLSGAKKRVSFVVEHGERWRQRLYHLCAFWSHADHLSHHIVDLYLKTLEADGIPIVTRSVAMHVPPEDVDQARSLLRGVLPTRRGPLVVIHPGARVASRCWPMENFAVVCDELQGKLGAQVLLLAGKGEESYVEDILMKVHTETKVIRAPLSVPQMASVLQEADLYLGHDSGPMHVAAAVGTPVVAMFGLQSTTLWKPAGDHHIVLQPPLPCDPCPFPNVCQPPNSYKTLCVRRITVGEVVEALRHQVERLSQSRALKGENY